MIELLFMNIPTVMCLLLLTQIENQFYFCLFFGFTYRSVVLTFPVLSENSLISRDRKSSNNRSPCLAAAKISSLKIQ